jgi:hypothetical protein
MYTPFGYVRRIVFTFVMGISSLTPISNLTLLLVFTILIMVSIYFYEPFDDIRTDYVTIFMESSLIIYILLLIILGLEIFSA